MADREIDAVERERLADICRAACGICGAALKAKEEADSAWHAAFFFYQQAVEDYRRALAASPDPARPGTDGEGRSDG